MNAKNASEPQRDPEWARERYVSAQFGLSHTLLYNLRRDGRIRSVSLRGEGKSYGARLFNIASIRQYLSCQEAAETKEVKP